MTNVIMENVVQIAATLLIMLIGVLGTWLTAKIGKREELKGITAATDELVWAAQTTVLELQQTTVEGWKKANADGKLTKDEIAELGKLLVDGAMKKMSSSAVKLLNAAGVDISEVIHSVGEALIAKIKANS